MKTTSVVSLAVSNDGKWIAAGGAYEIRVYEWDATTFFAHENDLELRGEPISRLTPFNSFNWCIRQGRGRLDRKRVRNLEHGSGSQVLAAGRTDRDGHLFKLQ